MEEGGALLSVKCGLCGINYFSMHVLASWNWCKIRNLDQNVLYFWTPWDLSSVSKALLLFWKIINRNLYPVHPGWLDNSPRQPTWPSCTHCIPDSDAVPAHWALKFNALFYPASISNSHLSGASLGLTVFPHIAGVSPFQRPAIMLSEGNKNG